jgi:hypothetical protein
MQKYFRTNDAAAIRDCGAVGAETTQNERENQKIRKSMGNQLIFGNMKKGLLVLVAVMTFTFSANALTFRWSGCNSDEPNPQRIELYLDGDCSFIDTDGQAYDGTYTIEKQGTGFIIKMQFEDSNLRILRGDVSLVYNNTVINSITFDGDLFRNYNCK